ncbi:ABC1 kinase family protein [Brachybacterium sp. DNPG3]
MASVTSRYRQIADVLVRNGLPVLAGQIGLREHIPDVLRRHRPAEDPVPAPVRLRRALEELGPTFVKLGQMLSTRSDLLPEDWTRELESLQSAAPAVPFAQVREVIERELGERAHELLDGIDSEPLASASIGQAHRARLADGTEVVVKVRKPGVGEEVIADLELLRSLASLASREWDVARDIDVEALVATFDRTLRAELDYRGEAANAERFRENLADDAAVRVPAVHAGLSTAEVLVEEDVHGIRITDAAALDAAGVDRPALARAATRTLVTMVLVDGFFHADPHPGNMFVGDDGVIALIDFGMVGRLGPTAREDLLRMLMALSHGDDEAAVSALLHLAPPRRGIDRRRLTADVGALMETLTRDPLAEVSMAAIVGRITALLRRHRLQLPPDVSTLLRMLVLTESSAVALDPEFHLSAVLDQVIPVAMMQLLSPSALAGRVGDAGLRALRLGTELPGRASRLLDDYEARGIDARLHSEDLEPFVERLEATADRLVVGMTMSALLISLGSVIAAQPGRASARDPLMLGVGGAVALAGAYLAAGAGPARRAARMVRRGLMKP